MCARASPLVFVEHRQGTEWGDARMNRAGHRKRHRAGQGGCVGERWEVYISGRVRQRAGCISKGTQGVYVYLACSVMQDYHNLYHYHYLWRLLSWRQFDKAFDGRSDSGARRGWGCWETMTHAGWDCVKVVSGGGGSGEGEVFGVVACCCFCYSC